MSFVVNLLVCLFVCYYFRHLKLPCLVCTYQSVDHAFVLVGWPHALSFLR